MYAYDDSMAGNTIVTKHPQGKRGRSIAVDKYEPVAEAIRAALQKRELTHNELMAGVVEALTGKFEGHISWYAETVKLDLEARGIIERTKSKPEKYRLT